MLSEHVCIVTGGGRGIGAATAKLLGQEGASVVVNDLGADLEGQGAAEDPAQETADAIEADGGEAVAHFGDVTDPEYVDGLVADTVDEYGRVDGVVNFAGILRDSLLIDMTDDEWDAVIDVHLRGHFCLLRGVGQHWEEIESDDGKGSQQRSFVCVSSRSVLGNVGQANYAAAKGGVLGLMRTAAKEYGRYGARVNALLPGAYTRMVDRIPDEHQPFTEEEMPPEKVAPMVGFLLSDEAAGVSGCTLYAGGDSIGLATDPHVEQWGFREGGWTVESIAERFQSDVAGDANLDRTTRSF